MASTTSGPSPGDSRQFDLSSSTRLRHRRLLSSDSGVASGGTSAGGADRVSRLSGSFRIGATSGVWADPIAMVTTGGGAGPVATATDAGAGADRVALCLLPFENSDVSQDTGSPTGSMWRAIGD